MSRPPPGDPLACVGLAGAQVMLGTSLPQFLADESRAHKGPGVEFHVTVPESELLGYQFLIAAESSSR